MTKGKQQILTPEILDQWKRKARRRRRTTWNYDDTWAEIKLLRVIASHEALRKAVRPPYSGPR